MNNVNDEIPDFLLNMLNSQFSKEDIEKILLGYKAKRPVTLRVNTLKSNIEAVKNQLKQLNIEFREAPWSNAANIVNTENTENTVNTANTALILENSTEQEIEGLEIYQNGEIYLQSLSSMLPPIIMNPKESEDILDMCAAPGGKTTQIAAITNNQANITACELNTIRSERLKYNIEKQGASSVYVMQKDSRTIDDFFSFDRILLDAPCSGSGTLNIEDKNTFKYFTPKLIEKSCKTQLTLLKKALQILKPGKEMIYSTCSILKCENEDIITAALKNANAQIVPIEFPGMQHLPLLPTSIPGTLCVCPNTLYEGFFIAKIIKMHN